ncbi:MAG TPA: methyl-accepting chemotaxis protein [Ktedonobacteraceae bacterium]
MWRFLINMSIARRLTVAATIAALIPGIVISILGSSYVNTLNTVNNTVQVDDTAVKLVTDMQADLLRMNALLGALSMAPGSEGNNIQNSREIIQLTGDFSSALATYQQDYQIATSAKMQSIRDALKNDSQGSQEPISQRSITYVVNLQWKSYKNAQNQTLQAVQKHTDENTLAGDIDQANIEYLPLKGNLDNLVVQTESISQLVVQINTFKIYPVFIWTIAAFLFSTLLVFAISYVINLTITRPLRQLVQLTKRIAQGDTNARAFVVGHDEIHMVATSMNIMLDSIVDLMKNIQQQHNFLEEHVQKLIREVKGLGSGDLRSRAEVTSDTLGFLAHSFNYIIDELSNLVIPVKTTTSEVETLVNITHEQITQLVHITMRQTQDIAEVTETMEQVTLSTQVVSEHYESLTETTCEMHQMAQRYRDDLECAQLETETEIAQKQQCTSHTTSLLTAIIALLERQKQSLEQTHTHLNQQTALSQSTFCKLQHMREETRKAGDETHNVTDTMSKLTRSLKTLHSVVGVFKV